MYQTPPNLFVWRVPNCPFVVFSSPRQRELCLGNGVRDFQTSCVPSKVKHTKSKFQGLFNMNHTPFSSSDVLRETGHIDGWMWVRNQGTGLRRVIPRCEKKSIWVPRFSGWNTWRGGQWLVCSYSPHQIFEPCDLWKDILVILSQLLCWWMQPITPVYFLLRWLSHRYPNRPANKISRWPSCGLWF